MESSVEALSRGPPSGTEIGEQLRLPLFQRDHLALQTLQLAVDTGQLGLGLLLAQIVSAVLVADERLDLSPQKPQKRVAIDRVAPVLELAIPDGLDDLIVRQPELLLRRLVAERRARALPFGFQVVHHYSIGLRSSSIG